MDYRRGVPAMVGALGLVGCGVAGAIAWADRLWGLLTAAALVTIWLCVLNWWAVVHPRIAPPPAATPADADAMALRVLLDAAPTPLLAIEGAAARALNRAARRLFATDDRILPVPATLTDPAVTHLRHEARHWRIDRVALPDGRGVAALIDIEQEERTAEARATADLIEVLGHELLNGLAPIVSLAESGVAVLARADVDAVLLREIVGTLARRADGLQRFTEAYRTLARLPEPVRRPVRLTDMADDLARLFAGHWPMVALSVAADEAEWPLDRDQLSQALWALLQNAAEAAVAATPAQVALRLHTEDAGLTIEVEDNGTGVPRDKATHIFRPFHTTKPDGTGVGLTLARQIALAHGGTLALLPTSETIFRLVLPDIRQGTGEPAIAARLVPPVANR